MSSIPLTRLLTRCCSYKIPSYSFDVIKTRFSTAGRSKCLGNSDFATKSRNEESSLNADFFVDVSHLISENLKRLRYGVCAADIDGDGLTEFFVCGFGSDNLLLKWNGKKLVNAARGTLLEDAGSLSIGVAAADIDGDGVEELYVLNTDTFGGRKRLTDRLFSKSKANEYEDLFSLPCNMDDANFFAGRSVCAVDRTGSGRYGFFVANYGGPMKLFELSEDGFLFDAAPAAGLVTYPTGGRSLVSLPLVSHCAMDIFVGNEGGPNFLFVNKGDGSGQYVECAAAYGLMDPLSACRGVAVVDIQNQEVAGSQSESEAELGALEFGLACGNWESEHRLFAKSGPGPVGGARALGFQDGEQGGFRDVAPSAMALPSRVRTVIAADFDNDGWQELFFHSIGQPNRLFRQSQEGWAEVPLVCGAEEHGLGTGAAVADIDNDGMLELLLSHGESGPQPLSLYKCPANSNSWLRVKPLTRQGAPARGAVVLLEDQTGRWQKRAIDAGSGYLCCMEPVAHFGLGQQANGVRVRITWPDGSIVELLDMAVNQVYVVPHPKTG